MKHIGYCEYDSDARIIRALIRARYRKKEHYARNTHKQRKLNKKKGLRKSESFIRTPLRSTRRDMACSEFRVMMDDDDYDGGWPYVNGAVNENQFRLPESND